MIVASLIILGVVIIITLNELTVIVMILAVVVNLGFAGIFFFLLAFMGRVITCFVIGFWIVRWAKRLWIRYGSTPPPAMNELKTPLFVGISVVAVVVNLPLGAFLGLIQLLITGLIAIAGLGAMFIYLRDIWYVTDRRLLFVRRDTAGRVIPPPPPEDADAALDASLGMDNLPPGFTWFND